MVEECHILEYTLQHFHKNVTLVPLAMHLAVIDGLKNDHIQLIILDHREDYSQEGDDGGNTLWHVTRMQTAKVTQLDALP